MKKYLSQELLFAIVLDLGIFLFASFITMDLNDPRETQLVYACAFILMVVIAVLGYRDH